MDDILDAEFEEQKNKLFSKRYFHIIAKIAGLLAIQMTTNFSYVAANTFFWLTLVYYMNSSVSINFRIESSANKIFFIILALMGAFIIGYMDSEIQLLNY